MTVTVHTPEIYTPLPVWDELTEGQWIVGGQDEPDPPDPPPPPPPPVPMPDPEDEALRRRRQRELTRAGAAQGRLSTIMNDRAGDRETLG